MKMFTPNKITKRYTTLIENLQFLEGERLGLDPRVHKHQIRILDEKIDLIRSEILEIDLKQRYRKINHAGTNRISSSTSH